jgi:hypothetical protein
MKNAVFWDVITCGSSMNRRFGGTYGLHHRSGKNQGAIVAIVNANISSSLIIPP